MNINTKIALVTPSLTYLGGVPTVVDFVYKTLQGVGRYKIGVISIPTAANDETSMRLLAPRTWLHGPQTQQRRWAGRDYVHVGTVFTEFEFQRYRPRRVLTELLNQYDLIQVVAGTPAWAAVASEVEPPVCLFAATTIAQDRRSRLQRTVGWRKAWLTWMTRLNEHAERKTLQWVNCTFAESDYTQQLLAPYVAPDRLRLGPPGVDADFFIPNIPYHARGHILVVGRLSDPRKNARLLLTAYHQLRQQLASAPKLALVGHSGLSLADQAYAAALGLTEHIETYIDVSVEQLRALYQQAALFVLSSDEEGLGIVILEAMACGLPVISTDCGGPATAIQLGITGLLTPVGDHEALAQAMQELLLDPERRRRMGQAGRAVIEQRFSLEAAGKVYLDVYDELLARRDTSRRSD